MLQTNGHYKSSSSPSKNKRVVRRKFDTYPKDGTKDRLIHAVLQCIKGMSLKDIVDGTEKFNKTKKPVCLTTVRNWYVPVAKGGTRYPRGHTMDCVLQAQGKRFVIEDVETGEIVG